MPKRTSKQWKDQQVLFFRRTATRLALLERIMARLGLEPDARGSWLAALDYALAQAAATAPVPVQGAGEEG